MSLSISMDPLYQRFNDARRAGRLPQAILLSGPQADNKSQLLVQMAMNLFCERLGCGVDVAEGNVVAALPCGECSACKAVLEKRYPDCHFVGEGGGGSIKIDGIRDLCAQVSTTSHGNAYKVIVMENAERLTEGAANAFLKTLEEPSGKACFLLSVVHPSLLPATLVSRCQHWVYDGSQAFETSPTAQAAYDALLNQLNAFLNHHQDPTQLADDYLTQAPDGLLYDWVFVMRDLARVLLRGEPGRVDGSTKEVFSAVLSRVSLNSVWVTLARLQEAQRLLLKQGNAINKTYVIEHIGVGLMSASNG